MEAKINQQIKFLRSKRPYRALFFEKERKNNNNINKITTIPVQHEIYKVFEVLCATMPTRDWTYSNQYGLYTRTVDIYYVKLKLTKKKNTYTVVAVASTVAAAAETALATNNNERIHHSTHTFHTHSISFVLDVFFFKPTSSNVAADIVVAAAGAIVNSLHTCTSECNRFGGFFGET